MTDEHTSEEIKNRLSNIGEAIGNIALEYITGLENENAELKERNTRISKELADKRRKSDEKCLMELAKKGYIKFCDSEKEALKESLSNSEKNLKHMTDRLAEAEVILLQELNAVTCEDSYLVRSRIYAFLGSETISANRKELCNSKYCVSKDPYKNSVAVPCYEVYSCANCGLFKR